MTLAMLLIIGGATAALFAADRVLERALEMPDLPMRRKRMDTPAKLFPHDAELQRRLGAATG